MSNGTGPESQFVGPCLPKETEYDDGDGKRDERHAVADGVAHFDGTKEFSLRKKNRKKERHARLNAMRTVYLNLQQQQRQHGPLEEFHNSGS